MQLCNISIAFIEIFVKKKRFLYSEGEKTGQICQNWTFSMTCCKTCKLSTRSLTVISPRNGNREENYRRQSLSQCRSKRENEKEERKSHRQDDE